MDREFHHQCGKIDLNQPPENLNILKFTCPKITKDNPIRVQDRNYFKYCSFEHL